MKITTYLFSLLFLLVTTIVTNAQKQTTEELELQLKTEQADTTKLKTLHKLTENYFRSDIQKSEEAAKKGLQLAREINSNKFLILFNIKYSIIYEKKGNLDSALLFIKKANSLISDATNYKIKSKILTQYSDILRTQGDIDGAIKKYLQALQISEDHNFADGEVSCHMGISGLYTRQKMYDKAYEHLKKCECRCDSIAPESVDFCHAVTYGNISTNLYYQKKLDSCIFYGLKAIKKKEELKQYNSLPSSYNIVAAAYAKQEKAELATLYYQKSLDICTKIKHTQGKISTLLHLSDLYQKTKNKKELELIMNQLDELYPQIQSQIKIQNYYTAKSNYNKLIGNYEKAIIYIERNQTLKDSLRNYKNSTLISELETEYETNKHIEAKKLAEAKKETAEANEKKSKLASEKDKQLATIAIVISILILGLLLFIISRIRIIHRQKKELNEAYIQLEINKNNEIDVSKLKAIKSQMNPHFIFNSLNSIQDLVLREETDKSYDYIVLFAELVRNTLSYSEQEFISIDKELDFLNVYLELEKLRFGDDFIYSIAYNGSPEIKIPSLVVQPFIENALLHGLLHKKGIKHLEILFEIDKQLTCTITDNGIGRAKASEIKKRQQKQHASFSTSAIKKRMAILSQQYEMDAHFEYQDLIDNGEIKGTRVIITMPFQLF